MVGLAAAVMGMVAVSKHKVRHLLVVAVVTLLSMRFVPDIVVSEIATIADPTDDTAVLRFYYWGLAWDMFLDNPIFGIGAANYPWTVQLYEVDSEASILGRSVAGRAAHSLYLTLLAELGLTGTITYVALVLAVLKSLLDNIRALRGYGETEAALIADLSRGMIASLFSFLLCGAFISVLYYPVFWYAVAATVALERRRRSVIAAHLQSAALPDGTVRHGFEGGGERHAFNSAAGARGSY
jgi:O-antigen ligase